MKDHFFNLNTFLNFQKDPENFEKSIDYIRSLYILAEKETDMASKKELHFKAYDLAKKWIQKNEQSYLAQKWYFFFFLVVKLFC